MADDPNPLGAFLRARRERVDPSDHGIRDAGRRRVPGLRREELAFLAGVSAPYYARLEQGRDRSPSPAVLDAIAAVLQLDAEAVAHLHRLVEPVPVRRRVRRAPERVSPLLTRMIDAWPLQAASVIGRYRDVLATNSLAVALNPGFGVGRNLVRDAFLDPATRELYLDWHDVALGAVAGLRASAGVDPDDPMLAALVGELSVKSEEFRTMWARHDVHAKTSGTKRYHHPLVGDLDLDYQTFTVNGADDQVLHVFSAAPGTPSADGLSLLARSAAERQPSPARESPTRRRRTISGKDTAMDDQRTHVPITYEAFDHVEGPFYHGTKAVLQVGDERVSGRESNFQQGRTMKNIYFTSLVETAAWGAELSTALAGLDERGHIYVVEPLGPFEDDPNVTNKKFQGNPTESYRTRHPLRVVGEVLDWDGHSPEVVQGMLTGLARLREQGLDIIED